MPCRCNVLPANGQAFRIDVAYRNHIDIIAFQGIFQVPGPAQTHTDKTEPEF